MKRILIKMEKFIASICTFIGVVMLLAFLTNTLAQIIFRDILRISAPWTEEMARFSFIWMIYFGTVAVEARKEHIRMDFILNRVPFPVKNILLKTFSIASILFVMVIFKGAVDILEHALVTPLSVSFPWMNAGILYIPLIITAPLIIFYLLISLFSRHSEEVNERIT